MSETLTVYFASQTGHVLGAVTRAAGAIPSAPRAASPEDVLVRGGFEGPRLDSTFLGFLVPSLRLSTLTMAPDLRPVLAPLGFEVPAQLDAVQPLAGKVTGISLDTNEVSVTVEFELPQEEPVLVLIIGSALPAPQIAVGAMPKQEKTVALPLANLPDGSYFVLALVRGHRPFAQNSNID